MIVLLGVLNSIAAFLWVNCPLLMAAEHKFKKNKNNNDTRGKKLIFSSYYT